MSSRTRCPKKRRKTRKRGRESFPRARGGRRARAETTPDPISDMRNPVLVANGQGFWGDSPLGPLRLVREGPLHYLTLDYLAEVTMSILQKQKRRDPKLGYASDFPKMLERVLKTCMEKGIKIVANAGGVNPLACREACAQVVRKLGLRGVKIGVI